MDMPRIPRLVSLLSPLDYVLEIIRLRAHLHCTLFSVSVLSQVAVRGAAAEVPLQQAGLQPRPARRDGGQDPPLVQFCSLAAAGSWPYQATLRA